MSTQVYVLPPPGELAPVRRPGTASWCCTSSGRWRRSSVSQTHLVSLTPLPDSWRLHSKEGERVLADNNQSNHHQFEHGEEGSYVPRGEQEGGNDERLILQTEPSSGRTGAVFPAKDTIGGGRRRSCLPGNQHATRPGPRSTSQGCSLENHPEAPTQPQGLFFSFQEASKLRSRALRLILHLEWTNS